MKDPEREPSRSWKWATASYAGYVLVLLGNTLPWPCTGYSPHDCIVLATSNLSDSLYGIMLVAALLVIPLEVTHWKSPLNYVAWFAYFLVAYLLIGAKLYPVTWIAPGAYLSLIYVNKDLVGPSFLVFPLSLVSVWFAIRPKTLQGIWRLATIVLLGALILLASYFFVLLTLDLVQSTLSPSPFADRPIFGSGPLLIVVGGALLLAAESFEIRRSRTNALPGEAARAQAASTSPKNLLTLGYWSAISVTVLSILPVFFGLFATSVPYDGGVSLLLDSVGIGLSIALLLSLLVLMICIDNYAPPRRKIWTRFALLFTIVYIAIALAHAFLLPAVIRTNPQLFDLLVASFPILARYGAIGFIDFTFVTLAGLCLLPVFPRNGIERAIRWCFATMAALTIVGGFGFALSQNSIASLPLLAGLVGQVIILPAAMALVSLVFRRADQQETRGKPNNPVA